MRALIAIRLSRVTDATTSPERQLKACRELCEQRGYEEVGVAEDLDISAGKTTPFTRPQLGDWLNNRVGEFDVIVFFRMDRVVRRLLDLADLIRWCDEHSVALVSASEAFLDLTLPFGDIIALLIAKVAEMELNAISERNKSAAQHNIKRGTYRGGIPPWGYLPKKVDGDWRLVQDEAQVAIITEVVERVLTREPLRAIAHDLTARGVLTTRDKFAQHQKRDAKGYQWSSSRLKESLTSPALLGYAMSGDEIVRNDDGSPVVRAEPILTREKFDRVSAELSQRENRAEPTKRSNALLLRVVYCGVCDRPMYKLKGGKGRSPRYRCSSAQYKDPCGNTSVPMDKADEVVERLVSGMLGESERLDKIWDAGDDRSAELDEVDAVLADLAGQIGVGPYRAGTPQRLRLNERIEALAKRQAALSSDVARPAGWVWVGTGEKFGDWWAAQDITAKNVWLREMGVRLGLNKDGPRFNLDLGDLETLTKGLNPAGAVARHQELFARMTEYGIAGREILADGDTIWHHKDGRTVRSSELKG
jgi:site-specific DNA recombinase